MLMKYANVNILTVSHCSLFLYAVTGYIYVLLADVIESSELIIWYMLINWLYLL